MNNSTKLLPTDLILVEVSQDATDFKIAEELPFGEKYLFSGWDTEVKTICRLRGKYELLGEVTADSISFDFERYVEKNNNGYKNYLIVPNKFNTSFESANESFYSLLQSNGIYFVNPIEKPEISLNDIIPDDYEQKLSKWQEAESKLIKKCVILKKIK